MTKLQKAAEAFNELSKRKKSKKNKKKGPGGGCCSSLDLVCSPSGPGPDLHSTLHDLVTVSHLHQNRKQLGKQLMLLD